MMDVTISQSNQLFKNQKTRMMEIVLGVNRNLIEHLLTDECGFIQGASIDYDFIKCNLISRDRDLAEIDFSFKQVIPYLYVQYESDILLYRRTKKQTETRLHEKLSIGIGGHINPIDTVDDSDAIIEGLKRELEEEITIKLESEPEFMGFINDDLSEVGKVHLGLVFRASAESRDFKVEEFDKMRCDWASQDQIKSSYEGMETWSQIVYNSLLKQQN